MSPLATGSAAGAAWLEGMERPQPARVAPDASFQTETGESRTLADFEGQVVLLNIWATWCAPCIREMPALDRLQAERGGDDFKVVALSTDRAGASAARPFFEKAGIENLDLFLDPKGSFVRAAKVTRMPTSFLIDPEGKIVGIYEGTAEWDGEEVQHMIDELANTSE